MKARSLPLLLAAGLALAATGCVDETGYECLLCVDETGYLRIDDVLYTGPRGLDEVPRPVTVIGLDGALPGRGALAVTGPSGDADAIVGPGDDGSFRAELVVALDDEVTFRFTPEGDEPRSTPFRFTDALDAPAPSTASSPLLSSPDPDGNVTVLLSGLVGAAPPFVVFNDDAAEPVVVYSDDGADVTLPASAQETVCVFHAGDSGQSVELCAEVP